MNKQEIADLKAIVQNALNKVMDAAEETQSGEQKEQFDLAAELIYRSIGHLLILESSMSKL